LITEPADFSAIKDTLCNNCASLEVAMPDFLKITVPMDRRTFASALFACFFAISLLNAAAALVMQRSFEFVWADDAGFQNSIYFKANLVLKGLALVPAIGIFFYFPVKRLIHIGISPVLFVAAYFALCIFDFTYIAAHWQPARDAKFDSLVQKFADAHNADSPFDKIAGPNDPGFDPSDPRAVDKLFRFPEFRVKDRGVKSLEQEPPLRNSYLALDGSGVKSFTPPKQRVTPFGIGLNLAYLFFLLLFPGGVWKRGGANDDPEPLPNLFDEEQGTHVLAPNADLSPSRRTAPPPAFGKRSGLRLGA
jgi:hypothetical protein